MMSSKLRERKSVVANTPNDDLYRSGRPRFAWQQLRIGRDRKWHFAGQQAGETVKMIVRKHKLFLLLSALPLVGSILMLCLALLGAAGYHPDNLIPWPFFEVLAVVLIIGTATWFVCGDLSRWYLETYIITNKRIINLRGLLEPTRQATALESVKQVGVDFEQFPGSWLDYGTVRVYLTGGDLIMSEVANPQKVKEALEELTQGIEEKASLMPPNPEGHLGPRRTFGGILNIPAEIHYTSGEFTVKYVQRSRYVLCTQLILPVLALLVALPLTVYIPLADTLANSNVGLWWFIMSMVVLGLFVTIFFIYTNYVDDVFIFTNKRIIDIERRYLFVYEMRTEVDYKNIRDIKVRVPNPLQRLLDIGDVNIEVVGTPGIVLPTVDHPFSIQDKIFEMQKYKEKVVEVKKIHDEKKELHMWFGKLATILGETTRLKGAPALVGQGLLEAMEVAGELGFHVSVSDEDASNPEIPSGRVVRQSPPARAAINPGGEIQVVLSA